MIGRVDAVNILIEPPEALRDASLATIRKALRQNADAILNQIAAQIFEHFTAAPRTVHSVEEAGQLARIDAANDYKNRIDKLTTH